MRYFRWTLNLGDGCKGEDRADAIRDALTQIDLEDLGAYLHLEEITDDEYLATCSGSQDPYE